MAGDCTNHALFAQASQTRPMNDIVDAQCGTYKRMEMSTGKTPPPATPSPFKTKGA